MNQIVNPYIAGSPVTGPEMFFGRQDVFDFISQTLTGKHRDQVIVLYGRRRTGKTSVLYQMRRHLSDRYLCIFIDLHGLALDGLDGFLWELTNHIRRSLRREYQIELPRPDKSEFMTDPRGQFEEYFLNQLWAETGEKHVLLMLDEAVRLQEQVQAGKLELDIFEYLRHLMQHYERLNFLFSLGSGLEEMEKQYALLFNVALYKRISFLERDAAVALITEPVQEYYEVAPAAVDHILDITSGHPYYTQLICHSVFNHWLGSGARLIGVEDIDDTLDEVVERGLAVLKYVWEESTPAERAVLAGMAAAMGEDKEAVTLDDVMAAWSDLEVTIPRGEAVKAVRSLTARDVIFGDDAYEFRVDLLHKWLLKYERLDWVREEIAGDIEEWQKIAEAVQPKPTRSSIPRWAAVPLLLTAAIVFLLLGAMFSSTVRDALPFLAFSPPADTAVPTVIHTATAVKVSQEAIASTDEPLLTEDDMKEDAGDNADSEQSRPSDPNSIWIIDRGQDYINDFNDYDPNGFHLDHQASIGEVDGEVALIMADWRAKTFFEQMYAGSYDLFYDLYLDFQPTSNQSFHVDIHMPNDALRYGFSFGDVLNVSFMGEGLTPEGEFQEYPISPEHNLQPGWNKIRFSVNKYRSEIDVFTNEILVLSIDDMPVANTAKIEFENVSTNVSAVDNVLLQPIASDYISGDEEIVGAEPAEVEESLSDEQKVSYFNDFNDYDLDGFSAERDASIGEVDGEVALIFEEWDASLVYDGLNLGSYELAFDLYIDFEPTTENHLEFDISMPGQSYYFQFKDEFYIEIKDELNFEINNEDWNQSKGQHTLHPGWNEVRLVVDEESSNISIYSNDELILTTDDLPIGKTTKVAFSNMAIFPAAIDNFSLQAVAFDEDDQETQKAGSNISIGTLKLDGESGYVEVPYANSLELTDALTIEAWVNANSRPSQVCINWEYCNMLPIVSQPNETSSIGNYYLGIENGYPVFGFETDDAVDVIYRADSGVSDGWHHLAAAHTFGQANDTKLYIDGKPLSGSWVAGQDVTNGFAYANTSEQYLIGVMTVGGSAYYDGLLDEVRIWNRSRTESEIKATMMQELTDDEEGLVGYWQFNESPGENVAVDSSTQGNDGILKGSAQFQTADTPLLLEPLQASTLVNPLDGMVMVYVPAGSFMMGSDEGESNEAPVHEVYLDAFWIDQTEVTNAQFAAFVENTGYVTTAEQDGWSWDSGPDWFEVAGADWRHPRGPDSDIDGLEDYPVVHVSWEDAYAYCDWRGDRLPTEAEWEKAARGTDRRRFPWGNEFSADRLNSCDANCPVTSKEESADDGYAYTSPVGTYQSGASPYGVLDMAGNVGEWTADWYQDNYYAQSPDSNPEGPASGSRKSERGESWNVYPDEFNSLTTVRRGHPANHRASINGFRCASSSAFRQPPPTGGSGVFVDSGQELGDSDSHVVALGDLDGDSSLDAIVGNFGANFVWFNDGTGELTDSGQRLGGGNCRAVSLGDFDGDGDLDAFVGYEDQEDLIWLNDGEGYFVDSGQKLDSAVSRAIATGDLDGDGDLDALVGHASANSVWLNDGAGNFKESSQSLGGYSTWAVALADVDSDGDLDAFFGNFGPNELWLNDGAGSFKNSNQSMGSSESQDVAIGDLDGDGDLDAFIANHLNQSNLVWLNDGNGRFSDSGQRLGASDSVDMALGDVDGDGDLDAFVANNMGQANKVWLNDGKGVFFDSGQDLGGYLSDGLALGDLDGDHDLDAYEANNAGQPDRVWINQD